MGVYDVVGGLRPGRTAFDVSEKSIFDADLGRLTPVVIKEVLPGDIVEIESKFVIRSQPLVVPIYHKITAYVHYFYVPNRIIWKDWERFITGGVTGDLSIPPPVFDQQFIKPFKVKRYGCWDYMHFPIMNAAGEPADSMSMSSCDISLLPFLAFWAIWRDYYRDSNLQLTYPNTGIDCEQDFSEQLDALWEFSMEVINGTGDPSKDGRLAMDVLPYRCWAKDYFMSALPFQQRGTSPAVPISGEAHTLFPSDNVGLGSISGKQAPYFEDDVVDYKAYLNTIGGQSANNFRGFLNDNSVILSALGVGIADLRYAIQTQKWLERNARAGYRYCEQLQSHFGVSPKDERLMRPEYIGGTFAPVVVSEVLQTNSDPDSDGPLGSFAGHGMAVTADFAGKYRAQEHGIIVGIMSIMPEALYQQGVNRAWRRKTRFDYYWPEFAHISEQEITRGELFWVNDPTKDDLRFGFQGAYDEYRTSQSYVCGKMATDLKYWTLSMIFDSPPALNEKFITTEALSKGRREAWAVPGVVDNEQGQFLVQHNMGCRMLRPMPYLPEPGLMDHF